MTASASTYDLTIVGHVTLDTIVRRETSSIRPGGVPYYAGIAASALGATVRIITRVALEDEDLLEEIRSAGVTVDNHASKVTTRFVNRYDNDEDDQRKQQVDAIADSLRPEHITGRSRLWYFGPLLPADISPECLGRLNGSELTALDAQGLTRLVSSRDVKAHWSERASYMLQFADIVKFSDEEARAAIGNGDESSILDSLWAEGREIVVTSGSRGSTIYVDGVSHHTAGMKPRRIADTTGCGDTYFAAYLWRRLQGDDPPRAARFGAAAAALKAENAGPLRLDAQTVIRFARLAETTEISRGKERT